MRKQLISLLMLCLLALSGTSHVLGQSLGSSLVDRLGINGLEKVNAVEQTKVSIDNSLLTSDQSYSVYDVNRDGEVSIVDIVILIDYILNSPSGGSLFQIYDVDCDGEVSVLDVIALIDYVLNGTSHDIPVISSAYYYIGTSNGWTPYDATYTLSNGGGDVYANPVFSVVIPATGGYNWFMIYPQETMEAAEGDFWLSNFIGYPQDGANGMSGTFVEGPNDQVAFSFKIPPIPSAAKYRLIFDMKRRTFDFEVIYPSDLASAEQLFKKCYDYIHGYGDIEAIGHVMTVDYVRRIWEANELTTDEAICGWGDAGIYEYDFNCYDATHPILWDLYYLLYISIGVCNDYLNTYGDYDATKTAEVRFIRAMDYFYLLDYWGNVPLITSTDASNSPQVSRAELFQWLEQELFSLRDGLSEPETRKEGDVDYGRVDRDAANLLLARLYLNAQVYTGVARWTDAARYAKMVMDGPHKLNTTGVTRSSGGIVWDYTPYQMLFMGDNGNTSAATEAVFPIPMHGANVSGYNTYYWGSTHFLISSTYDADMHEDPFNSDATNGIMTNATWGGNRARPQLVRLFFPNDNAPKGRRGFETFKYAADDRALFNTCYRTLENTNPSDFKDGYAVVKFNNFKTDGSQCSHNTFPDADFFLMRSAEAYLTYAEALTCQAGGVAPAQAVSAINAIRGRAHADQRSNYSLYQILDEWGREFYFEGRRRMDLIRFNRYGGNTEYVWSWKGGVLDGRNFDAFRNLFAIPEEELMANPNLVQNPGYDFSSLPPVVLVLSTSVNNVVDLANSDVIPFEWSEPEYYSWPPLSYRLEVSPTNEWNISIDEAAADVTGATVPDYASLPTRYSSCNVLMPVVELEKALAKIFRWNEDDVPEKLTIYVRCVTTAYHETIYSNVIALEVKPFFMDLSLATPIELWYLVGEGIGSKDWDNTENSVATGGLVPMYPTMDYEYHPLTGRGLIEYAGFFRAGKGFRLIKDPGRWDDQWGMSGDSFVKNVYDCESITVKKDGYYLIRLNTIIDELTIEPYEYYVGVFNTISMPGSYQGWNVLANFMNSMSTTVPNHDWYVMNVTYNEDTELKFTADNSWDYNWGNVDFPFGTGMGDGPGIPVKAGTYNVYFNDILGTYYFIRQ